MRRFPWRKTELLLPNALPDIGRETRPLSVVQVRTLHARKRVYFELEDAFGLR